MIDLQYNIPILAGQHTVWADRVRAALDARAPLGERGLLPGVRGEDLAVRTAAATWLSQPVERTWLTVGGHHGCLIALMAAGLAGKRVAVESLSYAGFLDQAKLLNIELLPCAMDKEGLHPNALRELCAREQDIAALFTMPTLHNPAGCTQSEARRREIAAIAREFELTIIEDDAYGFLHDDPQPLNYAQFAPERTFYVRGLSKNLAPACRTGLLIAPEAYAAKVANALKQSTTGVSLIFAEATCSMMADGTLDALIVKKRHEGARRQALAREILEGFDISAGPNAWHLWVTLPAGLTPQDAERLCAERGVSISGGNWFAAPGSEPPQAIRVGLGGETDAARALEGVRIVAAVLHNDI